MNFIIFKKINKKPLHLSAILFTIYIATITILGIAYCQKLKEFQTLSGINSSQQKVQTDNEQTIYQLKEQKSELRRNFEKLYMAVAQDHAYDIEESYQTCKTYPYETGSLIHALRNSDIDICQYSRQTWMESYSGINNIIKYLDVDY